jgi:hypothetical protein
MMQVFCLCSARPNRFAPRNRPSSSGMLKRGKSVRGSGSVRQISWIPNLQSRMIFAIFSIRTSLASSSKRGRYGSSNGQLTKTLYPYDAGTIHYLRDPAELRLLSDFRSTKRPVHDSRLTMTVFAADVTSLRLTDAARCVVRIWRSLAVMIDSLPDDRNVGRQRRILREVATTVWPWARRKAARSIRHESPMRASRQETGCLCRTSHPGMTSVLP